MPWSTDALASEIRASGSQVRLVLDIWNSGRHVRLPVVLQDGMVGKAMFRRQASGGEAIQGKIGD